jgi:hypothetical protein
MTETNLLNEQEASRLIGITRSELRLHAQQRTFGLKPRHFNRGEAYYTPQALQEFRRNLEARQAAESLFG